MALPRIIPKTWLGPRREQATSGLHRHKLGTMREGYISQPLFNKDAPADLDELITLLEQYGLDGSNFDSGGGGGGGTILHHNEVLKPAGDTVEASYQLTYLASDEHWPHVVCSGVPQRDNHDYDYDFATGVVTIDANMDLSDDDILWVRYDHYNELPPEMPDVISLFDSYADGDNSTSWSVAFTSTDPGDFIVIAAIGGDGGTMAIATSGYSILISDTFDDDDHIVIWTKESPGGETGASGTFAGSTIPPTYRRAVLCGVFRPNASVGVMDSEVSSDGSGATSTIPQITNCDEGELELLVIFQTNSTVSGSPDNSPSPWDNSIADVSGYLGKHSVRMSIHYTAADGDTSANGTQDHNGSIRVHRSYVFRIGS